MKNPAVARWGLLATVLLTAATLVGTAIAGYMAALDASTMIVRARAGDLVFAARRSIRQSRGNLGDAVQELVDEASPAGLLYAAVTSRTGKVLFWAGESATPVDGEQLPRMRPWPPTVVALPDGTERVFTRLSIPGVGRRRFRIGSTPQDLTNVPFAVVLEFDPQVTAPIVSRARWTLLAGVVAACLLMGAGLIFWRMSRRHEALWAQLTKDRQLRLLGEMSAVLGHELRNPLAALKGHAQLLLERLSEGPTRSSASTIVREAIRLEELTEQVLAFARTGVVERTPTDPVAVVRAAADAVGDPRIHISSSMDLPAWLLDRPRMEQVLHNLLRNAIQASPAGAPVDVAISIVNERLRIDVHDAGAGIPPGDAERIFEPFHTTRTRGTGLGLTVARRVVEGHGGSIEASNPPGGGALFRVEIPDAPAPAPAHSPAPSSLPPPARTFEKV